MTFVKGQSGNPGGRLKSKPITEAILRELKAQGPGKQTRTQELAGRLVQLACAGDVAAAKVVLSYVEGLPTQPHEVGGADGGPLEVIIRRVAGRGDAGDSPA